MLIYIFASPKKEVSGIIVCEGVMPAFEDDIKKLKDIKVFCYGWQLQTQLWGGSA